MYCLCPKYILSLRFDDVRLSICYCFNIKEILKDYSNVVKSFNSALLFIYVHAMNGNKGLVQDLQESKYAVFQFESALTSRGNIGS